MAGARHRFRVRVRVDWFRVLVELQCRGLSNHDVSRCIGVAARTVGGWKMGAEPSHRDGDALVQLWCSVCEKGREELPMARPMTAHRA